jgi:hypothetical protein
MLGGLGLELTRPRFGGSWQHVVQVRLNFIKHNGFKRILRQEDKRKDDIPRCYANNIVLYWAIYVRIKLKLPICSLEILVQLLYITSKKQDSKFSWLSPPHPTGLGQRSKNTKAGLSRA